MIHKIYSDLPSFKTIEFRRGLNILLADKTPGATERQTRNGAGKTSLIELVHFLAGSERGDLLKSSALKQYSFGMDVDIRNARVLVERSVQNSNEILVKGELSALGVSSKTQTKFSGDDIGIALSNTYWKELLGYVVFDLDAEEITQKFGPKFRMLFSYFVRRQMSNGFTNPYKNAGLQQTWDHQVAVSYLLGLDWTIARDWQLVREQEKNLRELRKAADEGALSEVIGKTADLRTQVIIAEDRSKRLREHLNAFQILPQYHDIEIEASNIGRQLGSLSDDNTIDRALIDELELSLRNEETPSYNELFQMYEESRVVLPDLVRRRFEEVRVFHDSVVQNRKTYLSGEIEAARNRINERIRTQRRLDGRQTELLRILRSHGALDQYAQLEAEHARAEAEAESLRRRFTAAEQLEGKKTELDIERTRLLRRLQQDFVEQRHVLQRAILAFEQISSALYEQAGSLTIEESLNGPVFDIKMPSARSKGISNMQIFCFDMMLMRLCQERGIGPGFLIHDSHLFDGVDERQIAKALEVGNSIAQEIDIQYIVTMNSDTLPRSVLREIEVDQYILPVLLTDSTEDGGLFGIRFD